MLEGGGAPVHHVGNHFDLQLGAGDLLLRGELRGATKEEGHDEDGAR